MKIFYYFKKAKGMRFSELIEKIYSKIYKNINDYFMRKRDLNNNTRIKFNYPLIKQSYIKILNLDVKDIDKNVACYLSRMYRSHKFDLLGSGWVSAGYDSKPLGVGGHKYDMHINAPASFEKDYKLIDWKRDFKSGFRWSEKKWYKDSRIGVKIGCDIKVPWELARLQHLPQLAIFSLVDENLRALNLVEFKNEILDFITHNPPRMGVNYSCTMDVGIRVANMLVAYDMFKSLDKEGVLGDKFRQNFTNSIYEHGLFIVNNLEYSPTLTSNHYLSDIVGLLYIAAYLDSSDEVDTWLAFSIQEIIAQMKKQFYDDGGNFESSSNYHRLSSELMIYASALICALPLKKLENLKNYNEKKWRKQPKLLPYSAQEYLIKDNGINFPTWFINRLFKAGRFTQDITKPNGEVAQFGDNDSGRLFRFSPNGEFLKSSEAAKKYLNLSGYKSDDELFWDENILNHSTLLACFEGLFDLENKSAFSFERSFISSLANKILIPQDIKYKTPKITHFDDNELKFTHTLSYAFDTKNLKFIPYPDSGIFIFRSDSSYLAICATPLGQNDNGGHTHNDKLSFELYSFNKDIFKDPGTYLYTAMPEMRNKFRSTLAHNVPIVADLEQNSWSDGYVGLFSMFKQSRIYVLEFSQNFISLALEYKDIKIVRKFKIENEALNITDMCNKKFTYNKFEFYSNGYGKAMKA